jgi:hypothetical protein
LTVYHRGPPETPEGAAWELFMEIRREEEKAGQPRGRSNRTLRAEMLDLYAECLIVAQGNRGSGAAFVH